MNPVMVVTRSMTKKSCEKNVEQAVASQASAADDLHDPVENDERRALDGPDRDEEKVDDELTFIPPTSTDFKALAAIDRATLIAEQKSDSTLIKCWESIQNPNSSSSRFFEKNGILYREFRGKKGMNVDQIVLPLKYRENLLELSHQAGWSGHLGINKTKARLLSEYYWPGCFKDVEHFVRSCDVCQRTGRPNQKRKAPMTAVPIITEPFRRVIVDIGGPLPATKESFKYLLTMVCPATKFPEAVPLRDATSVEVVDALLSIFARVGFPSEIQSDLGSVFTSALTTDFLQKCGIKIYDSSVNHPQSNSVEKVHSVMKRILRALCYEKKRDWHGSVACHAVCPSFSGTRVNGLQPSGACLRASITVTA